MRSCSRSRTINRRKNTNRLGGYDASDLLWSQTEKIDHTNGSVKLQFKHLMSRIVVKIVKGEKFEGKLPEDIAIHIYNTASDGLESAITNYNHSEQSRCISATFLF